MLLAPVVDMKNISSVSFIFLVLTLLIVIIPSSAAMNIDICSITHKVC